jgi:hypothetical protein
MLEKQVILLILRIDVMYDNEMPQHTLPGIRFRAGSKRIPMKMAGKEVSLMQNLTPP